jgi:hypothetical protein
MKPMELDEEMRAAMTELREAQRELDARELDKKALIPPGQDASSLTEADIAATRRAGDAWEAYLKLARKHWPEL